MADTQPPADNEGDQKARQDHEERVRRIEARVAQLKEGHAELHLDVALRKEKDSDTPCPDCGRERYYRDG
jgi:hypothetical protein